MIECLSERLFGKRGYLWPKYLPLCLRYLHPKRTLIQFLTLVLDVSLNCIQNIYFNLKNIKEMNSY